MYDQPKYLSVKKACVYLGLGRNTVLRLCQEHTQNFPAGRVGNQYRIDVDKLSLWRDDWLAGKFTI